MQRALKTESASGHFTPVPPAVKPIVRSDRRVGDAEIHAQRCAVVHPGHVRRLDDDMQAPAPVAVEQVGGGHMQIRDQRRVGRLAVMIGEVMQGIGVAIALLPPYGTDVMKGRGELRRGRTRGRVMCGGDL